MRGRNVCRRQCFLCTLKHFALKETFLLKYLKNNELYILFNHVNFITSNATKCNMNKTVKYQLVCGGKSVEADLGWLTMETSTLRGPTRLHDVTKLLLWLSWFRSTDPSLQKFHSVPLSLTFSICSCYTRLCTCAGGG